MPTLFPILRTVVPSVVLKLKTIWGNSVLPRCRPGPSLLTQALHQDTVRAERQAHHCCSTEVHDTVRGCCLPSVITWEACWKGHGDAYMTVWCGSSAKGHQQGSVAVQDYQLFLQQKLRLEPPVTGSVWPSGPKGPKKSQKGLPGRQARSAKKVPEKSKKSQTSLSLALFRDFFNFSALFCTAGRPGTTFLRLFWPLVPRRPDTPCNWSLQSQSKRSRVRLLSPIFFQIEL